MGKHTLDTPTSLGAGIVNVPSQNNGVVQSELPFKCDTVPTGTKEESRFLNEEEIGDLIEDLHWQGIHDGFDS